VVFFNSAGLRWRELCGGSLMGALLVGALVGALLGALVGALLVGALVGALVGGLWWEPGWTAASSCAKSVTKSGTGILSLLGLIFLVPYGICTLHPQLAARLAPNNPLQRATESIGGPWGGYARKSKGAVHSGKRVGFPPAYGSTVRGRRRPTRCFLLLCY
jgi:hypothetical protein